MIPELEKERRGAQSTWRVENKRHPKRRHQEAMCRYQRVGVEVEAERSITVNLAVGVRIEEHRLGGAERPASSPHANM